MKEKVDTKNNADALLFQSEKVLKDAGDAVDAADKEAIEKAQADLRAVIDSDNTEEIKQRAKRSPTPSIKSAKKCTPRQPLSSRLARMHRHRVRTATEPMMPILPKWTTINNG